jgi:hypothetical protein
VATTSEVTRLARPAAVDLTGKRRHLVRLNNSEQVVMAGAGEAHCAVLVEEAVAGRPATFDVTGVTKVVLGATVANNLTPLKPDANGRAIPATTGDSYSLVNLEPGVAGDIVEARIEAGKA